MAAGQAVVEAGTQLQQSRDATVDRDVAFVGIDHAGNHLQGGGLARAVGAQESDGLALTYLKAQVVVGAHLLVGDALEEQAEDARAVVGVEPIALRHVLELDGDGALFRGGDGIGIDVRHLACVLAALGIRMFNTFGQMSLLDDTHSKHEEGFYHAPSFRQYARASMNRKRADLMMDKVSAGEWPRLPARPSARSPRQGCRPAPRAGLEPLGL